jgi:primase-polymerase (primpol)-like protein
MIEKKKPSDLNESTALKTISFNPEGIPQELKAYPHWLPWKLEEKDRRFVKVPYSVQGHYRASVTNPKDRGNYDVAYGVFQRNPDVYSGLGFVLTEQDPFFILDYDHVKDPVTGRYESGILEEIISTNTYAEESISGTGLHVVGKGTIPGSKRRSGCREIYDSKRFFAITGNHVEGTPFAVNVVPEQALKTIYEKIDPLQYFTNLIRYSSNSILISYILQKSILNVGFFSYIYSSKI